MVYKAYVLAFFPASEEKAAAREIAAAVKGKVPAAEGRALEQGAEKLDQKPADGTGSRPPPAAPAPEEKPAPSRPGRPATRP